MSIQQSLRGKRPPQDGGQSFLGRPLTWPSLPRVAKAQMLVGVPKVSLMPPELINAERNRHIRRRLLLGGVGAAAVTALGIAAAAAVAVTAQTNLVGATQARDDATRQLLRYSRVQQLEQQIALSTAAQRVGSSTAIDLRNEITQIEAARPSGFTITGVTVDSASPIADYLQAENPLEGQRVGTITVTARTSSIDALPDWLTALTRIRGYADATPAVTTGTSGPYTVSVTTHITDEAYSTPLKKETGR